MPEIDPLEPSSCGCSPTPAIHLRVQSRSTSPSPSPNARLPLRNLLRCFSSACFSPPPSSPLFYLPPPFHLSWPTHPSVPPWGLCCPCLLPSFVPSFVHPHACPLNAAAWQAPWHAEQEARQTCSALRAPRPALPGSSARSPILPPQFLHQRLNSFLEPSPQLSQSPPSPPPGGSSLGHGLSPGYC